MKSGKRKKNARIALEQTVASLRQQIEKLENKFLNKKSESIITTPSNEQNEDMYCTDEEELARETDWILKKKRMYKKRKAESSPEISSPTKNLQHTIPVTNRNNKKSSEPPPINMVNIKDDRKLHEIIAEITNEFKIIALNNDVFKVNLSNIENYRKLTKKLKDDNMEWYTYESKQLRPIKVMARGLHPTCQPQSIIEDLKSKNLLIEQVINIMKKERLEGSTAAIKKPLPLFMLVFQNGEDINKIFSIKEILKLKVKIEPLKRGARVIPQCKRCQRFGHTRSYCGKEPRCVKCAGKHLTEECKRSKHEEPICVNCKGNHPANYRGCEIVKELQKRRGKLEQQNSNKRLSPRAAVSQTKLETASRAEINLPTHTRQIDATNKSYAQAIKNVKKNAGKEDLEQVQSLQQVLQDILAKLEQQENTNRTILNRLVKLEASNRMTARRRKKN